MVIPHGARITRPVFSPAKKAPGKKLCARRYSRLCGIFWNYGEILLANQEIGNNIKHKDKRMENVYPSFVNMQKYQNKTELTQLEKYGATGLLALRHR
jgi:hypothetical protein